MRRALRWVKRIVLGLLAFLVVVVGVVLIVLHTDWGRNKAREIVISIAKESIPGLHIERVDGSVLGELRIAGLRIDGLDGKPMLHAKSAKANVKLSALLSATVELEYVELADVDVLDPRSPVVPNEDPPFPWDVALPKVAVRNATIAVTGENPMTFEKVDLDAALAIGGGGGPIAVAASVKGAWREHGLPFDVKARAAIGERIEVSELKAALGDTTITSEKPILVDFERPLARLKIRATPAVVAKLAPQVSLPAPADLTIDITEAGSESRVEIEGAMGTTTLHAQLQGSIAKETVRGMIAANGIDVSTYIPRLTGSGSGVISVVASREHTHVTAVVRGQFLDLPHGQALVDIDRTPTGVRAMVVGGGTAGGSMAAMGELAVDGDRVELVGSRVVASMKNPSVASAGKIPFRGFIEVAGTAKGTIAPTMKIDLDGSVRGHGLVSIDPKMGGLAIAQVAGSADGSITEDGTFTRFRATVKNVSRGGEPLGTFEIDGRNRKDGKISLNLTAKPAMIPGGTLHVGAVVSLGAAETDPIRIELQEHSLTAPRIAWAGSGGSITIGEHEIVIEDIESRAGNASIAANVKIVKATDAITVKANVQNVPTSMFEPTARGLVTANVDLVRRGITWNGKATVAAMGVQLAPDQPALEASAVVTVANRRVTADVNASSFQLGSVRFVIDVDGPRDITDPLAWRRLERKAIRTALLGITRIDLAAAKVSTGGVIDGEVVLTGDDTSGSLAVKGVQTPLGAVQGQINFAPMGADLGLAAKLRVENFGEAQVAAQVVIPKHPFDPLEWKKLGRGVVGILTAQIDNVQLDPAKLATLGVDVPYRGRASVHLKLAAGSGQATALVDVRDVSGGILQRPVDVRIEARVEPGSTSATVHVRESKKTEWADGDERLLLADAALPGFGFDQWLADAGAVLATKLDGRLTIPNIDVVRTLAMLGRADVQSGKLDGSIAVAGTVGNPTASGELVVTNVTVKPRLAGRKLPALEELRITPGWDGTQVTVVVKGRESDGATLSIEARANPKALDKLYAKLVLHKFDIAPIAVFLPGPLVAATGKISADVTANGLAVEKIRGTLAIDNARVPVHPQVGTVRDANVEVKLSDTGLAYKISAKLGAGWVELSGGAQPDLKVVTFKGAVEKISPIGEIQPVVNAKINGTIFREEGLLRADAKLTGTSVTLDMEQGVELLEAEMPEDLFIGRKTAELTPATKQARLPRKPWIQIKVAFDSTPIYVKHELFEVRARASSRDGITINVGRDLGLEGSIAIERGDVNVLGRQYRVEPGPDKIRFDGSIDPLLALRLTHDFPELSLTADIVGRASEGKRQIVMSSTPATYTQDELYAFFLGADPTSGGTTGNVASNVGAAYASAKLGRYAKKVIPFKVDVIGCDAKSCRLGRWITENWLVQFQRRIEPRPDEPPQEVQLQYYFKKNWLIEGAGFTERFGGDILWRRRW